MRIWIGTDNGISGSLGIIPEGGEATWFPMPTFSTLKYTKEKKYVTRIHVPRLLEILAHYHSGTMRPIGILERPMVNPMMFQSTCSALRAHEATLIAFETLGIPYQFEDSKKWQKMLLPHGLKGASELKRASLEVGRRLFPHLSPKGDADSLLIAEYARRSGL
jgi:hypothetical protein